MRCCPLCKHDVYRNVYTKKHWQIIQCVNCQFVYVGNPDKNTAYPSSEGVEYIQSQTTNLHFRHFEIKAKLDKYFQNRQKVRLVEIGCGAGALGNLLQNNASPSYNYTGFEPSTLRAGFAAEQGLNIVNDYFSNKIAPANIDAVILDNVLEHVDNPIQFIREISQSLSKGSIVIVVVPNLKDIRRYLPKWKEKHYWRPRRHLNYFTYKHLKTLFEQNGFNLRSIEPMWVTEKQSLVNAWMSAFGVRVLGLYCYAVKK